MYHYRLVVVPRHIQREEFFNELGPVLEQHPKVTDFTSVPDAHVPIMCFQYNTISIDLVFARIAPGVLPAVLDILDEKYLRGVDAQTQRSLNGPRVADEILRLVPNIQTFRITLKSIKLWAKCTGISSNVMGYMGGITLALLTARVCQLFPNASPNMLVLRFFRVFADWKWPTPILLKPTEDKQMGFEVFDTSTCRDLMPIVTPVYPAMITTHNVSFSTLHVMRKQMQRAKTIVENIEWNIQKTTRTSSTTTNKWNELFQRLDFFSMYKHYLQIQICTFSLVNNNTITTNENYKQQHHRWFF
jgi:poly(A) polymerase